MLTRKDILDTANKIVNGEREDKHGAPENSFKILAELWSAYTQESITPVDAAIMLGLLKVARIKTGVNEEDNYIDLAGYAACAGELATLNQF